MVNIEFYINNLLADVGDNFSVRLNRQLINPGELNTKDAQYSFSVTLPPTKNNHAIFKYANVEEVAGKFNRNYTAELVINSVRIFVGNFRLSEVTGASYKGNLYVPAVRTIKDIFGDFNLNQIPEVRIPFTDFAASVSSINTAAKTSLQMAIFPYVLYGLLPKVPLDKNANNYSARNIWDDSVRIGMQDLPPSINVLMMLRHLFNSQGFELQGTAFNDDRLTRLYMSYKNPTDYVQPWNYGYHAKIKLSGSWASTRNKRAGDAFQFERGVNQSSDDGYNIYTADLFDAVNSQIYIIEDPGGNVIYKEVNDADNVTWAQTQVRIPSSGFYKVRFNSSVRIFDNENWRSTDGATGVQHVGGQSSHGGSNGFGINTPQFGMIGGHIQEVRLVRDRRNADFGLQSAKLDGKFYYNNQPQNQTFDEVSIPKYFPQVTENGQLNFIDLVQDRNHLLGFSFGLRPGNRSGDRSFINPRDEAYSGAQMQAAKPALSWDTSEADTTPTRLAVKSSGWWKYGRLGSYDSEDDNPNLNIDYSGGTKITGKVLNALGNAVDPDPGNLTVRFNDYQISALTGFQTPVSGWQTSDFIDVRNYENLRFTATVSEAPDAAILAYYDVNRLFIGAGIVGPAIGDTATYIDEPIAPPAEAVYVRLTGETSNPMTISGTDVTADNIILSRFPLQRYYTYVIDGGPTYSGFVYLHAGSNEGPRRIIPFVGGIAEFNTADFSIFGSTPNITLYLKTHNFDVDGVLTINRRIETDSEDVVDWELTDKYKIDLNNAPTNYAKRGQFNNAPINGNWGGQGEVNAVVWLEAGELLTVASVGSEGRYRRSGMHSTYGWVNHEVLFNLEIEPFRVDPDWLKVNFNGNGTAVMNWNDTPNFDTDSINLAGFLPSDMKANDFIDNFVKAFNLRLSQIDTNIFALDVKQSKAAVTNRYVDLDGIASVRNRVNTPLGLPSLYKLGFTINTDEEGYYETGDDGGGEYATGVIEENIVEQKSSFSYNWFKTITKQQSGGNITLQIPNISKHEVWTLGTPYPEAMLKRFTDLPLRFWYFDGLLNDQGANFDFNGVNIGLAKVSNTITGKSVLNYKNQPKTILDNYFTILINSSSHYTEAEAYLTPTQYEALDGSLMAKFNGDLYYVAEISGYDPSGRNKTKLKLIRKI